MPDIVVEPIEITTRTTKLVDESITQGPWYGINEMNLFASNSVVTRQRVDSIFTGGRRMISKLLLLAVFCSNPIFAQLADIELEMAYEGQENVIPELIREFTVTVTNNGPDSEASVSVFSEPFRSINGNPLEFEFARNPLIIGQECVFLQVFVEPLPGSTVGGQALSVNFPELLPGQSITCFGIYVSRIPLGSRTVRWTALFSEGTTDPNLSNNIWVGTFINKSEMVNVLDKFFVLGLMFLTLVIAFRIKSIRE